MSTYHVRKLPPFSVLPPDDQLNADVAALRRGESQAIVIPHQ
jgi:hypothetical protein